LGGIIIMLLIAILVAVGSHRLARRRGCNPVFWGTLGFMLGPLALPFLLFMPDRRSEREGQGPVK
jgi:dipeptide/tripeptide permease